jgi:hypothetical protein
VVILAFGCVANRRERRRLASTGSALERHHLIATRQNLLDGCALALIQVLVLARDRLASAVGHQLGMLALAGMHPVDRVALELQHRGCGQRPTRRAGLLLNGNEFASLHATIDLLLEVVDARFSERPLQGVTEDRAFLHDRFALQIAIACEGDCPACSV